MNKKNLLISWQSQRAGEEVLLNAIENLKTKKIKISKVLYLTSQEDGKISLEKKGIDLELIKIKLSPNEVTKHEKIYSILKKTLEIYLIQNKNYFWHINISPGTPAMHSVWLLLYAGGFFSDSTKLWSSQLEQQTNQTRIDEVIFPIETYLSEIKKYRKSNPTKAIFNPEESKSLKLKETLQKILRYSHVTGASLLIIGERGTGKTRLVESIVAKVKRKKVITVLCGSLTPELAMSQMFGHEKGAFTGADSEKEGFIQKANGKILFLDEIQDLPKAVQRMLVRVLQDPERRYIKLGSIEENNANFELVCASHLPILKLREILDEDLFDRISLLACEMPPIRETKEDLQNYWNATWRELRQDMNIPEKPFWNKSLEKHLINHPLKGNFRDLQRLAFILMSEELSDTTSGMEEKIQRGINESHNKIFNIEKNDSLQNSLLEITKGSWKERIFQLQYQLANETTEKYGTISLASKFLKCDKGTLSKILSKGRGD